MKAFTKDQKTLIEEIALFYAAFHTAIDEDSETGIRVWGSYLLEAQEKAGIEVTPNSVIRYALQAAS